MSRSRVRLPIARPRRPPLARQPARLQLAQDAQGRAPVRETSAWEVARESKEAHRGRELRSHGRGWQKCDTRDSRVTRDDAKSIQKIISARPCESLCLLCAQFELAPNAAPPLHDSTAATVQPVRPSGCPPFLVTSRDPIPHALAQLLVNETRATP